eukprot:TRINITY_DN75437_c0_g1_i1.p1 TRINITY_DN75437_c0_g1~~TRINITY_DN75437_c0_g1_i1.p1  ORF type:complete len:586 (+),score=58.09 TRINITY_DN75437_c0_g1_i1:33-1760(+)
MCRAGLFVAAVWALPGSWSESTDSLRFASLPTAPARYHRQQQDHFDASNSNTWKQAYYVNDTFWQPGSDAPIFLCVGGEGPPLDGSAVVSSVHCNVAAEWLPTKDALMFALEHRYYGCHNLSACPVSNLADSKALSFLSSRQAIEDVASFVTAMIDRYNLRPGINKWVTWGGSYPGMLAGWSRLKHPELIHASVASSAPVYATLDMPEYLDHMAMAYSISDNGVGGSPACRDAIRAGHAWIEDRLLAGLRGNVSQVQEVEKRFALPVGSLESLPQKIDFAAMGVANFPAQENDPLCEQPACNIAKVCHIMTNRSRGDEVQRLLDLRTAQGISGIERRHHKAWRSLAPWPRHSQRSAKLVLDDKSALPDFWEYQTCKEFGFYQTCEIGSACMFVRGIMNLSYYTERCMRLYGISIEDVASNINSTNAYYGGLLPTGPDQETLGRCVFWPNGEVDPWSTRSVLSPPSKDLPTLYVPGASHHSWTWPSRAGDQQSVLTARTRIREQVDFFLKQDCSEMGPVQHHTNLVIIILLTAVVLLMVLVGVAMYVRHRIKRARRPPLAQAALENGNEATGRQSM